MDTRKYSFSTMWKDTSTMRLRGFWDARSGILNLSCSRLASTSVSFCRKPFATRRGRDVYQSAVYPRQNCGKIDSSAPEPESRFLGMGSWFDSESAPALRQFLRYG